MKFGIGIIPHNNLNKIIEIAKLVEDVGFEYLWIADKPHNDTYLILEKIAQETETIKIGPGVTNPYTKNPEKTALEILNIDKISKNRAILGMSPGNKQTLDELNIPWDSPIKTLIKSIETISSINSQNSSHKIPIYIEAPSPKLLEVSGKYAEGVLITASHPTDYDNNIFEPIKQGANIAKKDISRFEIIAYTSTSISNNIEIAKNASKIVVAFIIAGSSPQVLENHHISPKISNEIYLNLSKGNIGNAIGLIDDNLIDAFSVTGTPDDIITKINALKEKGVTQFVAGAPIGNKLEPSIKLFEEVIASF